MLQAQKVLRKQNIRPKNIYIAQTKLSKFENLKISTRFLDHKTVMELCNKISEALVVKIICYFLRLNFG